MCSDIRFFAFLVVFSLGACTEQSIPDFADPVPLSVPSGKPAYGSRLTQADTDTAILSWMERGDDSALLRYSDFHLGVWQPAELAASDSQMFVNWADLPAVASLGNGALLAYWLSYTADETYSYQVLTSFSDDNGASWSTPLSPHTDGTATEHGFVSSFGDDKGIGLVWLDGRETPDKGMTLRSAVVTPGGERHDEVKLDNLVCDCCQTDIAETDAGPIAVYRDRTEDEIRDIYVSRRIDGQWQPGVAVSDDGWVIAGCPVNGPSIAADGDRVVVTWFSAANDTPTVKAAVSTNAGKSFSVPVEIASKNTLGRVGVTLIDRHSAAISWMQSDKKGSYAINLRAITFDGQMGRVNTIGRTGVSRTVPQQLRIGDELIFTWTDEMNEISKLASVRVRIRGFYD